MEEVRKLHLFEAFGVELEYMIVDSATLDVRPVCDEVIRLATGSIQSEVSFGPIAWSNELAAHVIELKTDGPAESLNGLSDLFLEHVRKINELAFENGWQLMPGAMHPWMNPDTEMKLWAHEYSPVYEAYNRIFDCRGHGWSNLQSVHLNLPFANDEEFGRLHAAIRLILPLLPAIAASSPVYGGKISKFADSRMEFYRTNSARIPSLTAGIVPEPVFSRAEYDLKIFQRIYRDIAPLDSEGVLQDEFLNSRGAIARFGRGSIEIRVLDIQESPAADLAVVQIIIALLKKLVAEDWSSLQSQQSVPTGILQSLMLESIRLAENAIVTNPAILRQFGRLEQAVPLADLWKTLAAELEEDNAELRKLNEPGGPLNTILTSGTLSRRLLKQVGTTPTKARLHQTWDQLCDCLQSGSMFLPDSGD